MLDRGNDLRSREFLEPSFHPVPLDDRMTLFSDNHGNPRMRKQGVARPNVQMLGTYSSPCFLYELNFGLAREPHGTRIPELLTRRRTCWAAVL